jgi:hypothetical protein
MAKKSRRARGKRRTGSKPLQRGPGARDQTLRATVEPKASVSSVGPSVSSAQAARYQYVLPELRRIGIIAGALFLVLIVLALILG